MDETIFDLIVGKVSEHFGDQPFLWMANKSHGEDLFSGNPNAERLPNVSHGLNSYQHIPNVVILSALNPRPADFKLMATLGFTPEELKTAIFYEAVYQAVMRCSLRSHGHSDPVQIVVMDKGSADYLANSIPDAKIEKLNWLDDIGPIIGKAGRPKTHSSKADKQRAYRNRKKALKEHTKFVSELDNKIVPVVESLKRRYDFPIIDIMDSVTKGFYGMQFTHLTAFFPRDIVRLESSSEFIEYLKHIHKRKLEKKEDNRLISPAFFNPQKSQDAERGDENVEFMRGLFLDFDGGDLSPEEFANLFPELQMAIFNTYRSRKHCPRFRVYIPSKEPFSPETYRTIIGGIMGRLEKAGFGESPEGKQHGLDMGKRSPCSLFYLPCKAEHEDGTFFHEFNDGKRSELDPKEWIRKYHREPEAEPTVDSIPREAFDDADEKKIQAAIDWWHLVAGDPGVGNKNFFELALRLRSAGLDEKQIEIVLNREAAVARTPKDRRRQIPSILNSLKS